MIMRNISISTTMRAFLALVMIISMMLILMMMTMMMRRKRRSKRMMRIVMMMRSAEQCVKACWLHGQGAARTGTLDSNGTLA